eukprot:COSAG01_NODE_34500_length_546_cov_1.926174_1_plen_47_part_10
MNIEGHAACIIVTDTGTLALWHRHQQAAMHAPAPRRPDPPRAWIDSI